MCEPPQQCSQATGSSEDKAVASLHGMLLHSVAGAGCTFTFINDVKHVYVKYGSLHIYLDSVAHLVHIMIDKITWLNMGGCKKDALWLHTQINMTNMILTNGALRFSNFDTYPFDKPNRNWVRFWRFLSKTMRTTWSVWRAIGRVSPVTRYLKISRMITFVGKATMNHGSLEYPMSKQTKFRFFQEKVGLLPGTNDMTCLLANLYLFHHVVQNLSSLSAKC